eukprot:TRINITY_DN8924_c0_g1_i2.p1 TRINITY_DN8924_c0_g1~~TRINITY_DN8924_c0_g1_i2.p1  ORF type:complete len:370 (-),score=68.61 TRINITY_DN8924_c0_g1_i2:788-1897(-)
MTRISTTGRQPTSHWNTAPGSPNRPAAPAWNGATAPSALAATSWIQPTPANSLATLPYNSAGENPNTALSAAASQGDVARVNGALSAGADPNYRDHYGWTALHWAVSAGQADTASLVLSVGADVNGVDNQGDSPLHWAAHFNHEPMCRLLLNQGASVQCKNNQGQYPMDMTRAAVIREALKIPEALPVVQQPVQQAHMTSFIGALPLNASATDKARIQGMASRLDAERRARVQSERSLIGVADLKIAADDLRVQLVSVEKAKKDSEQRIADLRPELERQRSAREDAERMLRELRQRLEDATQRLELATTNLQVAASYAKQKQDMERALFDDTHSVEVATKELETVKADFVSGRGRVRRADWAGVETGSG